MPRVHMTGDDTIFGLVCVIVIALVNKEVGSTILQFFPKVPPSS